MEVENEIWKTIPEYPNYQVSNTGKVKSLNYLRTRKEKLRKPVKNRCGYLNVSLWKEGKMKTIAIHTLVANAFIPNPNNLPEVNHRNEIKTDNRVENLEFCDRKYNCNYGSHNERMAKSKTGVYNTKNSKAVMCVETGKIYPSAAEVQRQLGFAQSGICNCCNKKYGCKTVGGYHWCYVE